MDDMPYCEAALLVRALRCFDVRSESGEAEEPRRRSEKDKGGDVAVWLHRPRDVVYVSLCVS